MRKIVSYSWFRHDASHYEHPDCGESRGKFFVNFLRVLVRAHWACWKGWELRIYHDERVREFPYFKVLYRMSQEGLVDLVDMGKAETLCGAMIWRMFPLEMPDVNYLVCRDVDSLPMPKDRRAVEEFIDSGKLVHCIHESESHSGLMGGMVAFDVPKCQSIQKPFLGPDQTIDWNQHGADQVYLNRHVYPKVKGAILFHRLGRARMNISEDEVRTIIRHPTPDGIHPTVMAFGDSFAGHIGGCYDVEPAFAFYEQIDTPEIEEIRECEKWALG